MQQGRRAFLRKAALMSAAPAGLAAAPIDRLRRAVEGLKQRTGNSIGVSTYSFWQFNGPKEETPITHCIDQAHAMGFDGVEILHIQMTSEDNDHLQRLKRQAFSLGLDLMGFSTHQDLLSPDPEERQQNVEETIHQIELAARLGIPTMRINTGRWGTTESFDELMANRGIEPPLDGYTDEDGFEWVIDAIEQCIPKAAECGVVLGLENH